jgi:hypothetical protein
LRSSPLSPTRFSPSSSACRWLFWITILLAITGVHVVYCVTRAAHPDQFLYGDAFYYERIAASMLEDGDLDLFDQLFDPENPDPNHYICHFGQVAWGRDGAFVPKHSVLLPLLSLPWYAVAGKPGLLAFNALLVVILVIGVARLAGGDTAAWITALLCLVTTPFLAFSYDYSPDVLGTLFVVWGFHAALRHRFRTAGLLLGLALWAKVHMILFVVLGGFGVLATDRGRGVSRFGTGLTPVLVALAAFQWWVYGAPWWTGYDRTAVLTPDGIEIWSHWIFFQAPILEGLVGQLIRPGAGLLWTAPLWLLWPLGMWQSVRTWPRSENPVHWPWLMGHGIVACYVLFAWYECWYMSQYGNRFLFPAVALGFVLMAPLTRAVMGWDLWKRKG